MSVIIETSIGDMVVDLYTDERPRCSMNFLKLCKMKYYNFSLFHSVQKDLVAQTGDPTATGRGGESIYGFLYGEQARFFEMEVVPRILHSKKGLLSMVNNGSGMHGSQFFITLADSVDYLNNKHTVFGEVAEGLDIVDKLNNAFCDDGNRPHQDIRIYHTVILDDPYDDPDGLVIPSKSPPPTQEMLDSDRIPCDADIDDEQGMTEEQLTEMAAEREAKANTQILEMVGDLPDQELAPPENVLFVCKLNPVTTSDDLEIIFSRFGTVVSCEVIKDQKTGESLQYAFVEFEKQENCEMAYFKMDNVLIDDRRIHVDFSQSVSKLKWKGKGKGVEIMNDGDAPKYILKDQQRKSDGYDLVYAHEELDEEVSKKDKKHKKSKRDDSQERSKGNHHNNDRDSGRNEDRRRDRYDDRDRDRNKDRRDTYNNVDRESRDKYEDMDRQRNRDRRDKYKEMDRERNRDRRDKYEDMDRERNRDRRDKYEDMDRQRSRENRDKYNERDRGRTERSREIDHKRYNESQRERKRSYSDHSDDDGSKYRSRKDMGSSRRAEDEIRKKKKSSRMESYSDDDNSTKKRNKSRNKRDQSYSDYSDDDGHVYKSKKDGNKNLKKSIRRGSSSEDDERQKEKGRHKNKKHKSEKKRGKYSDEESSSEEESRKRKQYDSDEEVRRKDKKKKRKA